MAASSLPEVTTNMCHGQKSVKHECSQNMKRQSCSSRLMLVSSSLARVYISTEALLLRLPTSPQTSFRTTQPKQESMTLVSFRPKAISKEIMAALVVPNFSKHPSYFPPFSRSVQIRPIGEILGCLLLSTS